MKQELTGGLNNDPVPRVAVVPYATVEEDPYVLPRNVCNLCWCTPEVGSVAHKDEAFARRWAFQDFAGIAALREQFMNAKIRPSGAAPHLRAS
jgi:hypothetical protein